MSGQLDICNQALSIVGTRSTIASLTEGSNEAQQCALHYDSCLTGLLRIVPWSFARKQATLALLYANAGTPENLAGIAPLPQAPWNYEYAWPQDCLRLRSIYQPASTVQVLTGLSGGLGSLLSPIPYTIGVDSDAAGNQIKVIYCDQAQAQLIYTCLVTDTFIWDSEFSDAMVFTMVARICIPLTGDVSKSELFLKKAQDAVLQARVTDATESPVTPECIPDWISARDYSPDS